MRFFHFCILTLFLFFNFNAFTKTIDEQFNEAESLIDIDQTKVALELLKTIQPKTEEQTAKQFYLLGRLYYSLDKFNKANEFYKDARLLDPTNPIYQVGLAQTNYALGKLKLSESNAKRALRNNPDLLEAELLLALISSRYGKQQEAEKRFLNLIDLQPSNQYLFLTYAKYLEQTENRNKAIALLEKFIIKNPDTADIHDYLGRLHWFNGNLDLAIEKRQLAAMLYRKSGNMLMSSNISRWVNSKKEKIIIEKRKEEEGKKALPPKQPKQKFTPNPGNEIEPFPDIVYEHAGGTGTGFIINDGRQIVTNRHVVEDSYKIFVRNGFGELRFANIEKMSEYDDLALLTLDTPYNSEYSLTIPENYKLRPGQSAIVMGFPLASSIGDTSPSFTEGIVSKITGLYDNTGKFLITSKLNKGNSGGPIFSETGELIGVAVEKLDSLLVIKDNKQVKEAIEDVNVAIKIDRVKRFIQSSEPVQNLPNLDLEDLYELKLPSVVMIVSLVPPKEEEIIETTPEEEINQAIEECLSDYDPKKSPNISREQFNDLCTCYIYGLVDIYDKKEAKHRATYNKPSDKFLNKEEKIIEGCYEEIIK